MSDPTAHDPTAPSAEPEYRHHVAPGPVPSAARQQGRPGTSAKTR